MDGKPERSFETQKKRKSFVSRLWSKSHSKQGKRPTTEKLVDFKGKNLSIFFFPFLLNISIVCPDSGTLCLQEKEEGTHSKTSAQGWFGLVIYYIIS